MARIAVVLNTSWNIYNFRLPLMRDLEEQGHELLAIAPTDEYTPRIPYAHYPVPIRSRSLNPARHAGVLGSLARTFRHARPDIALLYTIQPNVHGNLAAALTGVPTISNVAGLGHLFANPRPATRVAMGLYRQAFRHASRVFFQNREDLELFLERRLVAAHKAERIPGSGVDLQRFSPRESPAGERGEFVFLMACRMLRDKGVEVFVEAARRVHAIRPVARFVLAGPAEVDSPGAYSRAQLEALTAHPAISYRGVSDTIEEDIAQADCVVLPSHYREGVPRILLEAAAMGKPLIASDVVGCRDVVEDGVNGLLCEPRSAASLVERMLAMLAMPGEARAEMGRRGRARLEGEFDQRLVFECYARAIEAVLGGG